MDKYVVIGNPVAHSRSPLIHARFASQTGASLEYSRLLAPLDDFAGAASSFFASGGLGANVTVPFKEHAARWVDVLATPAEQAFAVNTIFLDRGRRIGTKIFQDDSCSSSTRPAERQVRGVVLSKEEGSLPVTPSAGNTAAPSRFGGLISASFLCRLGFHVDVSRTGIRLAVLKAFKRPFPKIGAAGSTAGAAAFVPVHTLSACMP